MTCSSVGGQRGKGEWTWRKVESFSMSFSRKLSNNFRATPFEIVINQGFPMWASEERVHSNSSPSTVTSIIHTFKRHTVKASLCVLNVQDWKCTFSFLSAEWKQNTMLQFRPTEFWKYNLLRWQWKAVTKAWQVDIPSNLFSVTLLRDLFSNQLSFLPTNTHILHCLTNGSSKPQTFLKIVTFNLNY